MAAEDFDFLFGSWNVRHKRLKERLKNGNVWEEFGGMAVTQPIIGGSGNIEDNVIDFLDGAYRAAALRSFDAAKNSWAIWWLDSRCPHNIDVPVVGRFEKGVGTFLADDKLDGKPIKVRFVWSEIKENTCIWEQAFSADDGRTWETNWIMEFARRV